MFLSPKTFARLVFYPWALLALTVLAAPTVVLFILIISGAMPELTGMFLVIATLLACSLLFAPVMKYLRQQAAAAGLRHEARQLIARGHYMEANFCLKQSERAQWRMLASMTLLLAAQFVFVKPVKAQMREVERAEPSRQAPRQPRTEAQHLVVARALQAELHLNEHGVIRALKYLRQGYPVNEVRNLFAPVVRKS